jgi:transposase InsO family protein
MYMVSMDILKLNTTKKGNQYLLVMVDFLTKFTVAEALPDQSADTVCHAVMRMTATMGNPKVLLTDQGSQFTGELFTALCQLKNVYPTVTTTYHPAGNSNVETMNRSIIAMLKAQVNRDCDEWDDLIPVVLQLYNSSVHTTHSGIPFKLMFGREPNMPSKSPLALAINVQSDEGIDGLKRTMRRAQCWARLNTLL